MNLITHGTMLTDNKYYYYESIGYTDNQIINQTAKV